MSTFNVGDTITTTVYMIGGRSDEVTGKIIDFKMRRKDTSRIGCYVVDASDLGYGLLCVEPEKARPVA
jgi:hypothetical protein